MSMLSSQCDELRQVAQVYRNLGKYATERMLLDAADTILELRDDLQRANSNLQDAEHDESMAWDRVRKAERENDRLRGLVTGLMGHVMHPPCEGCIAEMNCDCSDLTQCDEWLFFEADARKLGIEVDG